MAIQLGSAYGTISIDASGVKKGVDSAKGELGTLDRSIGGAAGSMGTLGFAAQAASGMLIGAFVGGLKMSIDAAIEAEKITVQTQAVIKSTGGAAGLTSDQIITMSESLAQVSTYGHDAIQSMENLLLTFPSIKGDTFKQATAAILDMSTALGKDLNESAIMVGKALQDPEKGITALRRVGVNFNATQTEMVKKMVETGHAAEAQAYILKELNTEFGGSAAAAANTFGGRLERLKDTFDKVAETIGNVIIPILGDALTAVDNFFNGVERLRALQAGHEEDMLKSAPDWKTYIDEIVRTGLATKEMVDQTDDYSGAEMEATRQRMLASGELLLYGDRLIRVWHNQTVLTQAQWDAKKAAWDWIQTIIKTSPAVQQVASDMAKAVTAATVSQEAYDAMVNSSRTEAIGYTADEQKLADLQGQLVALDAEISKNGPVRVAVTKAKISSDDELAAAQAKLIKLDEDLNVQGKKKNETDKEYASRMADTRVQIDNINAGYVKTTSVIGGATKAQDAQRLSLQKQIEEFQHASEIKKATQAFEALTKAYTDGSMSANEYAQRATMLNSISGLYTNSALNEAIAQQTLIKSLSDPASKDWAQQLLSNKKAIDGVADSTGAAAGALQTKFKPAISETSDILHGLQGKADTASASLVNIGKHVTAKIRADTSDADVKLTAAEKRILALENPVTVKIKANVSDLQDNAEQRAARVAASKPITVPIKYSVQGVAGDSMKERLLVKAELDVSDLQDNAEQRAARAKIAEQIVTKVVADTTDFDKSLLLSWGKAQEDGNTAVADVKTNAAIALSGISSLATTAQTQISGLKTSLDLLPKKGTFDYYITVHGAIPPLPVTTASVGTHASGGGRALGGPVLPNVPYIVGDRGVPEVFVPSVPGNIVPSVGDYARRSNGNTINHNEQITFQDALATKMWLEQQRLESIASVVNAM